MIEVYRSTNTNYQKNGDITLTPLECIFEWGLDGICQIELTHEYDDLGRWEYLVNDNVIAAPTPYSDKQLFRIYKREKSDDEVTVYARHIYYDNLGNYLVDVRPTNKNGQQALDIIFSGTKFTPHSDITTANTAYYVRKNIVEGNHKRITRSGKIKRYRRRSDYFSCYSYENGKRYYRNREPG